MKLSAIYNDYRGFISYELLADIEGNYLGYFKANVFFSSFCNQVIDDFVFYL